MPAKFRIPSRRLHKASGQSVVTLGGKDHYLGPHDSAESKRKYEQLVGEWMAKGRPRHNPDPEPTPGPTVAEVMLPYRKHIHAYYRRKDGTPTGEAANIELVLRPLLERFAHLPAADFGRAQIKAFRESLIASNLSRPEVNRRIGYVVQMFHWAADEGMVPASTWHELKCVKRLQRGRSKAPEPAEVEPVPMDRVEATLPHLSRHVAAMVRIQLLSGCRPSEVCEIKMADIDTSGPVWLYHPPQHKSAWRGRKRTIYLNPEAQQIISGFIRDDPQAPLFNPAEAEAEHRAAKRANRKTPLWPSHQRAQALKRKRKPKRRPRDRFSDQSYHHAIHRACDRAFPHPDLSAIPEKSLTADQQAELLAWRKAHRWHPHQLRHTAGTEARRQHGLDFAQVFLGHAKASTTEIYAKADEARVARVLGLEQG